MNRYLKMMVLPLAIALADTGTAAAQVIVNPDGTHSVVHGNVIVNPNGSHSVIHGNIIVNPNGSHSVIHGNLLVNPDGSHTIFPETGKLKRNHQKKVSGVSCRTKKPAQSGYWLTRWFSVSKSKIKAVPFCD